MSNNLPAFNQVLLVAGTGRNSGKTTFVSSICQTLSQEFKPVCMKISNHFHEQIGAVCLITAKDYKIYEETQVSSDKDTARMLASGASRVFFIEAEEPFIFTAFKSVLDLISPNIPIICESGGLRKYIKPSVFIMLHTKETDPKLSSKELMPLADRVLESDFGTLHIPHNIVTFENHKWKLNQ